MRSGILKIQQKSLNVTVQLYKITYMTPDEQEER